MPPYCFPVSDDGPSREGAWQTAEWSRAQDEQLAQLVQLIAAKKKIEKPERLGPKDFLSVDAKQFLRFQLLGPLGAALRSADVAE